MVCVYQKYKMERNFKTILIHHELDENDDEIRKLVVVHKLKSLGKTVDSLVKVLSHGFYTELEKAVNETLSEENIRKTCNAVIFQDDAFLRTGEGKTKQKFYNEIIKTFCLQLCEKVIKYIDARTGKEIKKIKGCFESKTSTVKPMTISFSLPSDEKTTSALADIMTEKNKEKIAPILIDLFVRKKEKNCREITNQLKEICLKTTNILEGLLVCIDHLKEDFAWSDQEKCKYIVYFKSIGYILPSALWIFKNIQRPLNKYKHSYFYTFYTFILLNIL